MQSSEPSRNVKKKKGKKKIKKPTPKNSGDPKKGKNLNDLDRTFDSKSSSSSAELHKPKPAKKLREAKPPTNPDDLFVIEDYNDTSQINLNQDRSISPLPKKLGPTKRNPKRKP